MELCKRRIPTPHSDKWNFPKFHELLHIIKDISHFGAPINYNAEQPESLSIPAAKQPGRRSQKRHATYIQQATRNLSSSYMILRVHEQMFPLPAARTQSLETGSHDIVQGTGRATCATLWTTQGCHDQKKDINCLLACSVRQD